MNCKTLCTLRLFVILIALSLSCVTGKAKRDNKRWFINGRLRNGGFLGHLRRSFKLKASGSSVKEHWFKQRLNHFEPADDRTWWQRYYVNKENYKEGGPVFLYIGGEGALEPEFIEAGHMAEMGKKFHALMFGLEHRFYGKSHPTSTLEGQHLKYLNSNQALADLANFRSQIGRPYNVTDAKWIAFGGSYPGNLAAWVRMKYPHLIYGSVASSAPVRAKLNFEEYLDVVANSIKSFTTNGDECLAAIASATRVIDRNMLFPKGPKMLEEKFKTCDELSEYSHDVQSFYQALASNFMGITQYDESPYEQLNLETACNVLLDKTYGLTAFDRYANLSYMFLDEYDSDCLDASYDKYLEELRRTDWDFHDMDGMRQWMWQTCTEFGYYQTSDSPDQPFGNHLGLRFSLNDCKKAFGLDFTDFEEDDLRKRVAETNANYGEDDIEVSRVIFVNGNKDPWHVLGVLKKKSLKSDYEVIVINGTSHCDDMMDSRPSDSPQLKMARERIADVISQWILSK